MENYSELCWVLVFFWGVESKQIKKLFKTYCNYTVTKSSYHCGKSRNADFSYAVNFHTVFCASRSVAACECSWYLCAVLQGNSPGSSWCL